MFIAMDGCMDIEPIFYERNLGDCVNIEHEHGNSTIFQTTTLTK